MQKRIVKWIILGLVLIMTFQAAKLLVFAVYRTPGLEVLRSGRSPSQLDGLALNAHSNQLDLRS